jgi:radical SAM superfamily enzyme YgiQ (UPF0313 family)
MTKTIVIYNPSRFNDEVWLPALWCQAKTYYELHGEKQNEWHWAACLADVWSDDFEKTKLILEHIEPDVFAVSLYVWNYVMGHRVAEWVKQRWPNCLVVTGGPHQYFKHNDDWFKKHPYIDASLPGDSFGEACIKEILDHVQEHGKIDWDQVGNICYPAGRSRFKKHSKKVYATKDRTSFDYDWSAFDSQLPLIKSFVEYTKKAFDRPKFLSIFETTRGCPYGCTYCDWGGGINTKVIKKDFEYVKKDIDALCTVGLTHLYFADANFGIFGERDVEIIKYLAKTRKKSQQWFSLGYGGFAKTENRLPYIREILKIDILNQLSSLGEIKISLQSLHSDVLKNIDRKNVGLDQQIAVFQSLATFRKLPIYVELIHGLPGMDLEKFYHELNVLGSKNLSVQWYPWILLPEAPAYSREYRKAQGIVTTIKTAEWWVDNDSTNNHTEIVVGSYSYTTDNYLEMLLASSLYHLFVQGGYYKNSIRYLNQQGIQIGSIIQSLLQEFLYNRNDHQSVIKHWREKILVDPGQKCFIKVGNQEVYLGLYFIAVAFLNHNTFGLSVGDWLKNKYQCPADKIIKDQQLSIHVENFGENTTQSIFQIDFHVTKHKTKSPLSDILSEFTQFKNSGNILRARKKLFGLINLD